MFYFCWPLFIDFRAPWELSPLLQTSNMKRPHPASERRKRKLSLQETEDKENNMCEYEKGREKLAWFFIFKPWGNSLLISLYFYTVSFFLTSFVLAMSFFTTIYEYRSVRVVRDQRWGLHLFSLCFLAWCIDLPFWSTLWVCRGLGCIYCFNHVFFLFWLADWLAESGLVFWLPSIFFLTFYLFLLALRRCRSMVSFFIIKASTRKKFCNMICLVAPVLCGASQAISYVMDVV